MIRLFNFLLLGVFTFITLACKTQKETVEYLNTENVSEDYSVSFIENGSIPMLMEKAKSENKSIDQVGIRFMRFCGKYDLNRISEQAQLYVEPFNAKLNA